MLLSVETAIASEQDTLEKAKVATVSLLWSIRTPARHSRLAQVEATRHVSKELMLTWVQLCRATSF